MRHHISTRLALTLVVTTGAWLASPAAAPAATIHNVTDCSDLQIALDATGTGDTVRLIGVECTGPFTLPAHQITFEGVDGAGLMGKGDRALVGVNVGQTVIRTLSFRNGAPAANGSGGAVRITGLSSPTIEGCRFVDNQVTGTGRGGALAIGQNNATAAGSVILRNNVFGELSHPNLAVTGFGGAVDLTAVRPIELIGNEVRSNGAGSGGGAVIIGINTVLLEGNTFAGNVVSQTGGGALLGVLDGKGTLRGNTFAKNTIIGAKPATGAHRGAGLDVEFFGEFGPPADGEGASPSSATASRTT